MDSAFVWDRVIAADILRDSSKSGIPLVLRKWTAGGDTAFCNGALYILPAFSGRIDAGDFRTYSE